ncbi:OmpA family protein [Marinobacterium mangrovicola]|uniref:Outer membrane protein OmpA-like peptidoglycan-associated protein n=1 Tax=Marinobacterium mangrovicola TaxID=1476959 RepID=A0A4R1GFE0_9GAMM|nr:OmpA family protein [Marinobacterium mangrovicola]TCK06924.1 outer membrane protein OmpA-like peptidoglycan-associated protein [Marinobacterium mangrovicola]
MIHKATAVSILSLALLGGCTTLDPYTQESKTSQATKGAGIGALSGAILGAVIADDSEGALAGAALGTAIGGGIGYYQDQQEMRLRQELEGTGVRVERMGDDIRLVMPGNITFATDSTRIDSGFYPVLDSVAKVLMKFDKTQVDVEGYTDSTGSAEYNQDLSERRAQSVAQYLMSVGVDRLRLNARGYGERNPIADNSSASGRAINRRVEVRIRGTQR